MDVQILGQVVYGKELRCLNILSKYSDKCMSVRV